MRYCDKKMIRVGRRQVTQWIGSRMGDELQALLRATVMLRRKKQQVLPELPSKHRQRIVLDIIDAAALKEVKR